MNVIGNIDHDRFVDIVALVFVIGDLLSWVR